MRPKDKDRVLFDAVAKVLRRKFSTAERSFYVRHLIERDQPAATEGGQRLLADAMKTTFDIKDWRLTPASVNHLAKQCRTGADDTGHQVAEYLDRIRIAEQLLAPCVSLLAFLLTRDNQPLDEVAESVRKEWGSGLKSVNPKALEGLEFELVDASGERESACRWLASADALAKGDYVRVIQHLLDQNREVMLMRGGAAPWAEIRDRKVHVNFVAEDAASLPSRAELPSYWVHSYFLDSLRTVTMQLEA